MDESNQSFLKLAKSWFPILSVLILFLGLLKNWIYYIHFGIKIQFYITVPELLLTMADELAIILILTSFYFGMVLIYFNDKKLFINGILEDKFEFKRLKIYLGALVSLATWAILMLPLKTKDWFTFFIIPTAILYPVIFLETAILFKKMGKKLNHKLFHGVSLILVFFIFFFNFTFIEIQATDKGKYFGTKIYTKDSTYTSDSEHYYIGKTTSYYFIYNKGKNSTTIIPEREVLRCELK